MAFEKKEYTLLERFEQRAVSKSEARRVYGLIFSGNYSIMDLTLGDLMAIKGMGRKGALLVMEVVCDLAVKK